MRFALTAEVGLRAAEAWKKVAGCMEGLAAWKWIRGAATAGEG